MCTIRKAIRFQSKSSDLSPTVISDQIFSDILKASDDVQPRFDNWKVIVEVQSIMAYIMIFHLTATKFLDCFDHIAYYGLLS